MKPLLSLLCLGLLSSASLAQEAKVEEKKAETKAVANVTVIMETNHGDIHIELDAKKAPITVANFLTYVDAKAYDGVVFHRIISNFMIQGGGFTSKDGKLTKKPVAGKPIKNESATSGSNKRGTISMARTGVVDSATNQFFINVVNNDGTEQFNLDYPHSQGHGYAVFGKVVKGMDVVDKIKAVKTTRAGGMANVPVEPVIMKSVKRAKK